MPREASLLWSLRYPSIDHAVVDPAPRLLSGRAVARRRWRHSLAPAACREAEAGPGRCMRRCRYRTVTHPTLGRTRSIRGAPHLSLPPPALADPRLRGERCTARLPAHWIFGSPPPARGRGRFASMRSAVRGSHPPPPPARGRKLARIAWDSAHGSPPPARGRCQWDVAFGTMTGSPPPLRGRPMVYAAGLVRSGAPPPARGRRAVSSRRGFLTGSPPPARGRVWCQQQPAGSERITPACAGKGRLQANSCRASRGHPRLCGEGHFFTFAPSHTMGSPPPVRGREDDIRDVTCELG